MKLHPDDPRLSAYLLGELSAEEAAAVQRAVAADPALGLAIKDLEAVQTLLSDTLAPAAEALLPRQRNAILQAARHADQGGKIAPLPSQRRALKSFLIPIAAAAAIIPLIFLLTRIPSGKPIAKTPPQPPVPTGELPLEVALFPAPGPPDAGSPPESRPTASAGHLQASRARAAALEQNGDLFLRKVAERLSREPAPDPDALPLLRPRTPVNAASHPYLDLPVHAGRSSIDWVTRSIRGQAKLPPPETVRLEEILNHFTLRPAGPTAIARGTTLSTELIPCPWKPSASLLLISFRGAATENRSISARFEADPAAVNRYRLLGFASIPGLPPGKLPSRVPAGSITSLVIEIEPTDPSAVLGSITWNVDSQPAPPVPIQRQTGAEPSDDARFAALVCTFAQWLTAENPGIIDADLVSAIARENVSENMPADRVDFLNLIDQALRL